MKRLLLSALVVLSLAPATAHASREATDEEASAVIADLAAEDGRATCSADARVGDVRVSTVDPESAVVVDGSPDCNFDLILVIRSEGSWTAITWLDADELGSCRIIASPRVAADLGLCDTSARCEVLPLTKTTRRGLSTAAPKSSRLVGTPKVGRCGDRFYALASYSFPRVGTTDQPSLVVRRPGGAWRNSGEAGGDPLCALAARKRIPWSLSDAWKIEPMECSS